jgi:hypothetical protein
LAFTLIETARQAWMRHPAGGAGCRQAASWAAADAADEIVSGDAVPSPPRLDVIEVNRAGPVPHAAMVASRSPALRDMLAFSCLLNCTVTIESSLSWLGCRGFPVIRRGLSWTAR